MSLPNEWATFKLDQLGIPHGKVTGTGIEPIHDRCDGHHGPGAHCRCDKTIGAILWVYHTYTGKAPCRAEAIEYDTFEDLWLDFAEWAPA